MSTQSPPLPAEPGRPTKRAIELFRAAAAKLGEESDIVESDDSAKPPGLEQAIESGLGRGSTIRVLYQSPSSDGMSLLYAWFKSNFPLPPHSHDADCLYYVVAGKLLFGTERLGPGDGFFVPAHAVYSYKAGPFGVEVLEFRNVSRFDIRMLKGTSAYWAKVAAISAANRELWMEEAPPARQSTGLG